MQVAQLALQGAVSRPQVGVWVQGPGSPWWHLPLLTLFSPALTAPALAPPNALASFCLRSPAHRGPPSPKPTCPWSLLPPCLHSLARATSGHTPTPLPGTAVARQPGARYPAPLGPGGQGWRERDRRPGEGQGGTGSHFSMPVFILPPPPKPESLLGPLSGQTLE